MPGTMFWYRCRSDPQMHVVVTWVDQIAVIRCIKLQMEGRKGRY